MNEKVTQYDGTIYMADVMLRLQCCCLLQNVTAWSWKSG